MKTLPALALSCALAGAVGCESIFTAMLGVGASTGVRHQLSGYASKTFTENLSRVEMAAVSALFFMDMKVNSAERSGTGEIIRATAAGRQIEIELEALTPNTTRITAIARRDTMVLDPATAVEIITQTERALGAI